MSVIDNHPETTKNNHVMRDNPLPVLMPHLKQQRWTCHSCGHCCRTLVGHLFPEECARLDEQNWTETLGVDPYLKTTFGGVLNKRPDGACVFLDDHNRCLIHTRFGEAAKPIACRIFPFAVRPVRLGWQASFRFDCPSAAQSLGIPVLQYRPLLEELTGRLIHEAPVDDDVADLQPGGPQATPDEIQALEQRFLLWLESPGLPLGNRLIGAARVTHSLHEARLDKVRGGRLVELLDLLFGASLSELSRRPAPPTNRQRGLLRQLAFAHAEHVSLAELRASWRRKFVRRWMQLRAARRFQRGRGEAPSLPGFHGAAAFAAIEAVRPATATADTDAIADLVQRYLTARILGRTVFGSGYYGWSVTNGLSALWMAVAAAGWLARYAAAAAERSALTFDDFAAALGVVDRAAGRLPSLGAAAERARIAYLHRYDGAARLLAAYNPVE